MRSGERRVRSWKCFEYRGGGGIGLVDEVIFSNPDTSDGGGRRRQERHESQRWLNEANVAAVRAGVYLRVADRNCDGCA